jgi:hypothetical protein
MMEWHNDAVSSRNRARIAAGRIFSRSSPVLSGTQIDDEARVRISSITPLPECVHASPAATLSSVPVHIAWRPIRNCVMTVYVSHFKASADAACAFRRQVRAARLVSELRGSS